MKNLHPKIHAACDAIGEVIEKHPGGRKDDEGRAALEQQIRILDDAYGHLGYFAEKIGQMREWADALYSVRKHRSWDGPGDSGAQKLGALDSRSCRQLFRSAPHF